MERTDRDLPMISILAGVVVSAIGVALLLGSLKVSWTVLGLGLLLTVVFSFFFASVAANAIATTARNPVSGMTMLTIIISSCGAAALWTFWHDGHVLCDGDCGHGMHGALGERTDHHRSEDGLLDRLDSGGAGEGEVSGRDRRRHRRRTDHRDAGADIPVWRSSDWRSAGRCWLRRRPRS